MLRFGVSYSIIVAVLLFVSCSSPQQSPAGQAFSVARQQSALQQFTYAMRNYYLPASNEQGDAANKLCREAVVAFDAVFTYFPDSDDFLPLVEARFYQGMCLVALNEKRKAAEAFLAAFRYPLPGAPLNRNLADRINYHEQAGKQLMRLRLEMTPAEREEVDSEK